MKRTKIIHKEKACRGEGKALGHGCGKLNMYRKYGLGIECKCYGNWLLNTPEGDKLIKRQTIPIQKKRADFEKAAQEHSDRKSIPYLLNAAQIACNAYIRERDRGHSCPACNAQWNPDFQASHIYPSSKFPSLRFDEDNIFGNDVGCNIFKEGNIENFRIGIIKLKGKDFMDALDAKAEKCKQTLHKWESDYLIAIRKQYQQKLKDLKSKQ